MSIDVPDTTLQANAYALAYRLLGDRPAARAASVVAAERLRMDTSDGRYWLARLALLTIDQTVAPGVDEAIEASGTEDEHAGLRAALRRRLVNSSPGERIAGTLVHLAGYEPAFLAGPLGTTPERVVELAGVLAPPPGVDYRDLGDPELTGRGRTAGEPRRGMRRPHWTTVAAVAVVVAAVIAATQVTGPRPTLGPRIDEGGLSVQQDPAEQEAPAVPGTTDDTPDGSEGQRNGGPLTQATND